jgi:DNA-binding HxlR family transcriptional regulator
MILHGKKRYGDLLDAEEKIATNILADRLTHLEAAGVVNKAQDPENRRSYIYSLTQKGLALTPIILEIVRWSGSHLKMNKSRRELLKRIDTDRNNLIAEIYARENKSLPKLAI